MSLQIIRKSILAVVVAGGLLAGGILAGRLVAAPMAEHGRFSARRIFDHISSRLDLSDSQRSQIKEILKSHQTAILAQLEAQKEARHALHASVQASTLDETLIRQKAADLARVQGDGAVLLAQIRSEVLPVLNDEQRSKLETFHQRLSKKGDRLIDSVRQFLNSAD